MNKIVFTGTVISAESGISTFRDTNGLWEKHNIDEKQFDAIFYEKGTDAILKIEKIINEK